MPYITNSEILFILNPNSGHGNVSKVINTIRQIDKSLTCIITSNTAEVKEVFQRHIENYKVFVIVGGDGSVNEAVNYLQHRPDKYLTVYPNGSGNGFANELGFRRDIASLIHDINIGDTLVLDVIRINENLSINIAGVGLDSCVAHAFGKTKNRGLLNYILLSIKSLLTFKPFRATVASDDFNHTGTFQMIVIANTRQFGNNAIIAPFALPNDGKIDLVLVKPIPFYLYPIYLFQMFTGRLKKTRYINFIKTSNPISIDSAYKEFHIDGEPIRFDDTVRISIEMNRITIIKTANNPIKGI